MKFPERYDVAAARNIAQLLKQISPRDYERVVARLAAQANGGLGQNDTEDTGFWRGLLDAGVDVLGTFADYKIQEEQARAQQDQYEEATAAELERQKMLAEQARTRQQEYEAEMELIRQQRELERAKESAVSRMKYAGYGIAALVGLWIFYRVAVV